jgi:hypothetical protein
MNLYRTNVSTAGDEITDGDGGDAIGGGTGTGTARGGDGGDGGDAIGSSSCSDVIGGVFVYLFFLGLDTKQCCVCINNQAVIIWP